MIAKAEKKNMLDSITSLDTNIALVHSSSERQYLCPPCKRGMKPTSLTSVRLVYQYEILHVNTLLDSQYSINSKEINSLYSFS